MKDNTEKTLDVLQRLGVIQKEYRDPLKAVMEYTCAKDVMKAVRFCVEYTYYDLIGQFYEKYEAIDDNPQMPEL